MKNQNIAELLSGKKYPGRGIIIGRSPDGNHAVIAYFIMGRSANSRNRVFEIREDNMHGDIRTKAFDESQLTDPSLIIYNPVQTHWNRVIVTNGDQTDTISELIDEKDLTFEQSIKFIEFEPDKPYYTPRISAVLNFCCREPYFDYALSIAKTADGDPASCRRFVYNYDKPIKGQGHFIHTYGDDDVNLPSFSGEPITVSIDSDDIDVFSKTLWDNLNADNKVSLFVRYVSMLDGESVQRIVNVR
ncbi:MAG: IMP cyclohydrolase [Oscillospiraceae bacterium]|nr:IMP cyclohydrolase [Oscillospiraceae bacterium]